MISISLYWELKSEYYVYVHIWHTVQHKIKSSLIAIQLYLTLHIILSLLEYMSCMHYFYIFKAGPLFFRGHFSSCTITRHLTKRFFVFSIIHFILHLGGLFYVWKLLIRGEGVIIHLYIGISLTLGSEIGFQPPTDHP